MSQFKLIRHRLGMTQAAMASALRTVQGNIAHYEKGRSIPEKRARRLIDLARERGLEIGFDHIYGEADLPPEASTYAASTSEAAI